LHRVYTAAGFHNVIASSGTAFTEVQAKLLGRFSKNIVVNFDPDTAKGRPRRNDRWRCWSVKIFRSKC
jgi:hypothetical protein